MSKHVCVLAPWEAEELLGKQQIPNCSRHRHVGVLEAEEMTRPDGLLYLRPIAEWVGKGQRRIMMITEYDLVRRKTDGGSGPVVLNLIEKRDLPAGKGRKLWNLL